MTNDDLLVKLGALAREEEAELSGLSVPPLSAEERQAIADAVLAAGPVRTPAARPGAGRFRRWWPALAIPALAACAFLLVLRPSPFHDGAPPLPDYSARIEGGLQDSRGAAPSGSPSGSPSGRIDGAVQRVTPQSVLTIVVTPAVDVRGEVGARVFLVGGGRVRELSVRPQVAPSGAVRVEVTGLADLLDRSGSTAQLRVTVGHPEALAQGTAGGGNDLRSFAFSVQRAPD